MQNKLVLYTNHISRGNIVQWVLEEIGLNYTIEYIEYGEQMQSKEYTQINPMAQVPSIVHNGITITETPAICAYLADMFPEANLAPQINKRGEYYRWLFFTAGPLEMMRRKDVLHPYNPKNKNKLIEDLHFELIPKILLETLNHNNYIIGDQFTVADIYIGSRLRFLIKLGVIKSNDIFEDYWHRISNRPAYITSHVLGAKRLKEHFNLT